MENSEKPETKVSTKRRRITQACDYCHQRSIRCRPSNDIQKCQNCKDFAQECTYHRKPRRRGIKPRDKSTDQENLSADAVTPPLDNPDVEQAQQSSGPFRNTRCVPVPRAVSVSSSQWKAPYVASQANIMDLVEIYFEVVYPIFPFFHRPTFIRRVSRAEYATERSLFALTMALCALVSGRIRDGSVTNPKWDLKPLYELQPGLFFDEAKKHLLDLTSESNINILRAHAILAIAAIQDEKIREMHHHIGAYHTLVAMDGLHIEANWPRGIGAVEREERRRLFWSMYTLDIYTAVVWGGIIRCSECQSDVGYPAEVDDEMIDDNSMTLQDLPHGNASQMFSGRADCWLSGWNFITDLYRVLEHALTRLRGYRRRQTTNPFLVGMFEDDFTVTKSSVRESVVRMYLSLPSCFKETPEMVYDARKDRFGFQAANITATFQLLRIVLFAASGSSIKERCQVASEVVEAFVSIPVTYLLSISTPLLHHLGGIGTILGNVLEEPISESDYTCVREVMISMAQLLENLEVIHHSTSESERLRSQVARIDKYMATQRQISLSTAALTGTGGIVEQPLIGTQGNQTYQEIISDIPLDWTLPENGELLGDLTWNFNLN
ncbi:c6 transcription factor [Fusarium longipes]|uniref:C6 transcription factor n=1 Tax=Fusarium longipes TaxID=694270 RepID=A0A395T9N1_9HYPO|nr:c6 transcription factor [Fusarium longipes]